MTEPLIGSLCSGAGMLDEGVRAVLGGRVAWHAEVDPAASRVLAHRYPAVPNLGDLTTVDWASVEPVDVLTAGYPCQPDSLAGKGLSTDDHRWIFPGIARAIGVLRPGLIVLENVAGHFVRGFRTVLGSLTVLGYDAVWTLVRASDVGAPHRRERLFVVAWPAALADRVGCPGWAEADSQRWTNGSGPRRAIARPRTDAATDADLARREGAESARRRDLPTWGAAADAHNDSARDGRQSGDARRGGTEPAQRRATAADTESERRPGSVEPRSHMEQDRPVTAHAGASRGAVDWGPYAPAIARWGHVLGRPAPAPTEPGPRGGQRLSPRLTEWMMGWPGGWVTDVPGISRNDALRICGNGVVPQQAAEALRRLLPHVAGERAA